jgi:hypothetical protein
MRYKCVTQPELQRNLAGDQKEAIAGFACVVKLIRYLKQETNAMLYAKMKVT